ncbi:fibroblast growth factor-binding protein 1-like [Myxocyprinus asiaticus]|uniref:fibroblast growth factor-binding protein 1-like n=1 Tax=Myxocyprinus asiaticus TaxID=70543 RepID=UPI002221BE72|nr:fibroblast growth factor-binding protein 1-like [Myxocyprinus asiaticus]
MMRVKDIALVLIFTCLVQQFLHVKSLRDRGRRAQTDGKGGRRGQRNDSGPNVSSDTGVWRGRFSLKDRAQCMWVAAAEGDASVLGVTCKNGAKSFDCEYVAKPTACQQYVSNAKAYWKQIARALKKKKGLCRDSTALIRAGMCRKAPKDAHFRLKDTRSSSHLSSPPPAGTNLCPDRIDRLKLADEYCTSSWSPMCTFLFLMFENDECS